MPRFSMLLLMLPAFSALRAQDPAYTVAQIADTRYRNREPVISETGLVAWFAYPTAALDNPKLGSQIFLWHGDALHSPTLEHPLFMEQANSHPLVSGNEVLWITTRSTAEEALRPPTWFLRDPPDAIRFDPAAPELPAWYSTANALALQGLAGERDFNLEPKEQIIMGPFSNVTAWAESYLNAADALATNVTSLAGPDATNQVATAGRRALVQQPDGDFWAVGVSPTAMRGASGYQELARFSIEGTNGVDRFTHDYLNDIAPSFDGGLVAWQKSKAYPFGWEIMALDGEERMQLTTNYVYEMGAKVHGRQIAWYGWDGNDYEIFLYDADTRKITQITSNDYDDVSPVIWNGQLAWEAYETLEPNIWFWSGAEGAEPVRISRNFYRDEHPRIWDGQVVWQGFDGDDFEVFSWDGRQVKGTPGEILPAPVNLSVQAFGNNFHDDVHPDIRDGVVVWMAYIGNQDAEIIAWKDGRMHRLTDNDVEDRFPKTAAGRIVWQTINYENSEINLAVPNP